MLEIKKAAAAGTMESSLINFRLLNERRTQA